MQSMQKLIDRTTDRVERWAEWWIRHMEGDSALGYSTNTVEAKIMNGTVGSDPGYSDPTRVPDVMMPPGVSQVDRAIKDLPRHHRLSLVCRYLIPGTERQKIDAFKHYTHKSERSYYSIQREALFFLAGRAL